MEGMIRTDGRKGNGPSIAEGPQQAQTMHELDHEDFERLGDELLSTSMNAEFNKFKAEQRTLLEQKNQIQKRIESMRREYDFIQNLDARDVNYVLDKKREHAAIIVQRNWRRLQAERAFRRNRFGKRTEVQDYSKTEEDIRRIKDNTDQLERARAYFTKNRPDLFYDKISEDRREALQEQVTSARKLKSDADIAKLSAIDIFDQYLPLYHRFNNQYTYNEQIRAQGHDQLVWTEIMTKFMVELSPEDMARANQHIPQTDRTDEQNRAEQRAAEEAAQRLGQIKVWSEIADNFTNEDKTECIRAHKERLARHRKRKDWEAWIEKDDLDIDGERILAEIKNYKNEHFWNKKFIA